MSVGYRPPTSSQTARNPRTDGSGAPTCMACSITTTSVWPFLIYCEGRREPTNFRPSSLIPPTVTSPSLIGGQITPSDTWTLPFSEHYWAIGRTLDSYFPLIQKVNNV